MPPVRSASAARRAGLGFIHQDLGLVPALDAVDNIALGQRYASRFWLSGRREARDARMLLCWTGGSSLDVTVMYLSLLMFELWFAAVGTQDTRTLGKSLILAALRAHHLEKNRRPTRQTFSLDLD
jgi:hypothetical protein